MQCRPNVLLVAALSLVMTLTVAPARTRRTLFRTDRSGSWCRSLPAADSTHSRAFAQKFTTKTRPDSDRGKPDGCRRQSGAEAVYRAEPDGYTMMFTQPAPLTVSKALYGRTSFEAEEFVPIGMASLQDIMLGGQFRTCRSRTCRN